MIGDTGPTPQPTDPAEPEVTGHGQSPTVERARGQDTLRVRPSPPPIWSRTDEQTLTENEQTSREGRERNAVERKRTADRRELTAQARLDLASQRDAAADARDLTALARDRAAASRDLAMTQLDAASEEEAGLRAITGQEILLRAGEQRRSAARYRAKAAEHRALAAEDREVAARDREQAGRERLEALADREALARELAIAATDALTGARTRAAGLTELDHELDRCQRTGALLVVTYVDVIGLKAINDTEGHAHGDDLLIRVVALIKAYLRSYDLVIRLGGDEFLSVMSNMTLPDARDRFSQVAAALGGGSGRGAIRTGFAALAPHETASELIARADKQLLRSRRN
jgi:diguanylate cyclase (GGDEF)-like protein